jgi:DNA-binding NarL/FixJ family response regulator
MSRKTKIVIAEDHTILREGLKALISSNPEFEIVGEAKDGAEAIRSVNNIRPDLVLMDLSMPKMSGMSAIVEIKKSAPETKILVLTIHNMEEYILEALRAGANGYVLKDADQEELLLAIKTVLEGKSFLSPSVSKKVIEGYLEGKKSVKTDTSWETLTQREREVLKLIAEGYKNKEIANLLFISAKTVEKHRANLMKKLDIHNVQSLTAFAIERGLISD